MFNTYRTIILLILLLQYSEIFGQDDCCDQRIDQLSLFEPRLTGERYQVRNTVGTQLFMDSWFKGDVFLISGEIAKYEDLAYNGYLDELIWENQGRPGLVCLDKEQVVSFTLNDAGRRHSYVFKHLQGNIENEGKSFDGFALELKEGPVALYVTHRIRSEGKIEKEVNDVIIHMEEVTEAPAVYLIGLPGQKFLSLNKIKRRSLCNILPEQKEIMKSMLNRHQINLKTENDLIGCIQLLESNEFFK